MAGIIDTLTLAGTLVLAIPAALAGLEFLFVRGEPVLGVALIGLAAGLVVLERFLTLPSDVPALLAQRVVGSVASDPDPDSEATEKD